MLHQQSGRVDTGSCLYVAQLTFHIKALEIRLFHTGKDKRLPELPDSV